MICDEEEYVVEKILDKRIYKNQTQYLIKWDGYPENQSTWEPKDNLNNAKLWVNKFEKMRLKTLGYSKEKAVSELGNNNNIYFVEEREKAEIAISKSLEENIMEAQVNNDNPIKICSAEIIDKDLCFLVEWEVRSDGIKPESSFLYNNFIKEFYPLLLIEFYETKVKFIKKKRKSEEGLKIL